jgi:hypothetical protein
MSTGTCFYAADPDEHRHLLLRCGSRRAPVLVRVRSVEASPCAVTRQQLSRATHRFALFQRSSDINENDLLKADNLVGGVQVLSVAEPRQRI